MDFRIKKTWVAALGLALAVSTASGVALAYGADGTVGGDVATLPDPNNIVPLKLYDAAGNVVTTGSTTAPIAAFAAADSTVRTGDAYASLFAHLPQSSAAPGEWPGLQVSGTDKYSGGGAVTAPGSLAGKPYVRTTAAGYTLADVKKALPNNETGQTFVGVYELRLRTSSANGVSDQYAAAYVKITGTTWAVTTAPVLGGGGPTTPTPVGTSVAATWPATLTYGAASSVSVTVSPASGAAKPSGTVRLVKGSTTLSTATLSSAGTATLALAGTALTPGSQALKVVYPGVANAFTGSESAVKTITVAKATPGTPTFKVVKAPTAKKKGSGTIAVPAPSGLPAAGGTAKVTITKGKATKTITVTIVNGAATVKLPKLTPGKWTLTVAYQGDGSYVATTSKGYKIKVKKVKKK